MTVTGDDSYLIDLLWVLLLFYLDRQHGGFDDATFQATLAPADSLDSVHKHVAAFGFVLVLGKLWASGELRGVFFVGRFCLTERFPRISQLSEYLL